MEESVKERLIAFIKYKGISIRRFEMACGLSNGYIKSLRYTPTMEKMRSIIRAFPEINQTWLLTGEGEMLIKDAEERPRISYTTGRPYYNVDFELGFVELVNDQTVNPDYLIDFAPYNNSCDCWCNAHGDSMYPTISSGDILALKHIDDIRYLINGEIYAIITRNGLRTIKRIHDNGDTVTLIPDNKQVGEQTIPKSLILHIYSVKGCFKTF